jgi:hypothetical protein
VDASRLGAGLATLVDRFWRIGNDDSPVVATTGEVPSTHVLVEEYLVLSSPARPHYLVPASAPRAVAAAFSGHLATSKSSSRALGATVASGARLGILGRVNRSRLRVGIDSRIPVDRRSDWLILARLAQELDVPEAFGIIPVRRQMPNSKPTARVFTQDGLALGYLKLAWSDATDRLVDNETRTLVSLDGRVGPVTTPTIAASGEWSGHPFQLAGALPAGIRPWSGVPGHPSAVQAVASSGWVTSVALAGSEYAQGTVDRLEYSRAAFPAEADALLGWLRRLSTSPGADQALQMGRWHGDWIPWNLGQISDMTVAWDWEYSSPSTPLGFDLVHWHFQSRLARHDGTLSVAVGAAWRNAAQLSDVGVPVEQHRLVVAAYLIEILTRATHLAAQGAGWNPKLRPELLDLAAADGELTFARGR